jgi:hypothetical protein
MNDIPKIVISYVEVTDDNTNMTGFSLSSDDLVCFDIDTNLEFLRPDTAYKRAIKCLFNYPHDFNQTSLVLSDRFIGYYECHNTTVIEIPEDEIVVSIDIAVFDESKLRAFMINENMMELLKISHASGKSLTQVNIEDGGKWIFKM